MAGHRKDADATGGASTALSAIDGARVAVYTVDRAGCVTAWSREAERMKGYTPAQAIGLSASVFYDSEDRNNAVAERELLSAIGGQETFEGWRVRQDGSRFRASVRILPLADARGHITSFVKITREVPGARRRVPNGGESHTTLQEALLSLAVHLRALQLVINASGTQSADLVVAKLSVIEWRLAQLEETFRAILAPPNGGSPRAPDT